jgi:hypothetical protein
MSGAILAEHAADVARTVSIDMTVVESTGLRSRLEARIIRIARTDPKTAALLTRGLSTK